MSVTTTTQPLSEPSTVPLPGLAVAQALAQAGRLEDAWRLALRHAESEPESAASHHMAAMLAVMRQDAVAALHHAARALALAPADARISFTAGRAHKLAGDLPRAMAAYRRATAQDPTYAEPHVSLGIALKHAGDLAGAVACYEKALSLQPKLAAAHANLAYARAALVEKAAEAGAQAVPPAAALEAAARAASIEPGNAVLHFNLGLLLRAAHERHRAIDAFNQALGLEPSNFGYCLHLGRDLVAVGNATAAIVLYRQWQAGNPPSPAVMRALADQLSRLGQVSEALKWAEQAVQLDAEPRAWLLLAGIHQQCRRLDDSMNAGRRAIQISGGDWTTYSIPLMVCNYALQDPQPIASLHAEFGRALAAAVPARRVWPSRTARPAGQKLRIGYYSADFIHHSVAYFMAPLLVHHERSRFDVTCYFSRGWGDSMTDHFKSLGHGWVDCEHLSDAALAQRIENDGIDILIDLTGHTAGSRPSLFALAPAPLQMSYLGYPTATGVQTIAHRISDHVIDPGDMPSSGSETPLCLPGSMFCYRPPKSPPIGPVPSQTAGLVTYGSFNNHAKISDQCLDLWARLLHAVPASRLLLKSAAAADPVNRAQLEAYMAARGISASRLDLRARIDSRDGHLAAYNEVDIALDPFPYNGATTTCEALWMGVPVVTLRGATHTGRMGASILQAAGQGQWITGSEAEYLALARQLAYSPAVRAGWRKAARQTLTASSLCNEPAFTRAYEELLETAWLASSPPPMCSPPSSGGSGGATCPAA